MSNEDKHTNNLIEKEKQLEAYLDLLYSYNSNDPKQFYLSLSQLALEDNSIYKELYQLISENIISQGNEYEFTSKDTDSNHKKESEKFDIKINSQIKKVNNIANASKSVKVQNIETIPEVNNTLLKINSDGEYSYNDQSEDDNEEEN